MLIEDITVGLCGISKNLMGKLSNRYFEAALTESRESGISMIQIGTTKIQDMSKSRLFSFVKYKDWSKLRTYSSIHLSDLIIPGVFYWADRSRSRIFSFKEFSAFFSLA